MDCNPGTTFCVSVQKDSEYVYLELSLAGNELEPVDMDTWSETEVTYAPYGIISISDVCPDPNS